jgi:hypothetical protein
MPSDNIETWLGWTGLGFGVIIAYSAYKNVSLFGPDSLIGNTLRNGIIPQVDKLPKKEGSSKGGFIPNIPGIPVPGSLTPQPPVGSSQNPVRPA